MSRETTKQQPAGGGPPAVAGSQLFSSLTDLPFPPVSRNTQKPPFSGPPVSTTRLRRWPGWFAGTDGWDGRGGWPLEKKIMPEKSRASRFPGARAWLTIHPAIRRPGNSLAWLPAVGWRGEGGGRADPTLSSTLTACGISAAVASCQVSSPLTFPLSSSRQHRTPSRHQWNPTVGVASRRRRRCRWEHGSPEMAIVPDSDKRFLVGSVPLNRAASRLYSTNHNISGATLPRW